jgi:plasmid maintenance system killer protein
MTFTSIQDEISHSFKTKKYMELTTIQDIIGEEIEKIQADVDQLNHVLAVLDWQTTEAKEIYDRQTKFEANLHFLKTIGFFLASQESQLEILRLKSDTDSQRIAFLREALANKTTMFNAASAMLNLYQMQRDHWSKSLEKDLEKEFSLEEMQTIIPQLQKQAA